MAKKFQTRESALAFIDTIPLFTLRQLTADLLMESREKITITEEQFKEHFKIRGQKEDGTEEKRGRPKAE